MLSNQYKQLLALSCLPRLGVRKLHDLLSAVDGDLSPVSFKEFLSQNQLALYNEFLAGKGVIAQRLENVSQLMQYHDIRICSILDEEYPRLLHHIYDSPLLLFYKGDISLASRAQVAIVGSRNASVSGLDHAYSFAKTLAQHGVVITSGLAQGIDCAAHTAAVANAQPTIAVMGAGLDMIYPKSNKQLADNLLANGCWISEYLPGSRPVAANFPRRNRIISGMSLGVLVVEARLKSGTLITARMALEHNREVFAIPGSIDFEGSKGCHALISQGAKLVESAEDILQELNLLAPFDQNSVQHKTQGAQHSQVLLAPSQLSDSNKAVYAALDYQPRSIEQLALSCQLSASEVASCLTDMELEGVIAKQGNSYIRRG